jgi:hypothetical protein
VSITNAHGQLIACLEHGVTDIHDRQRRWSIAPSDLQGRPCPGEERVVTERPRGPATRGEVAGNAAISLHLPVTPDVQDTAAKTQTEIDGTASIILLPLCIGGGG